MKKQKRQNIPVTYNFVRLPDNVRKAYSDSKKLYPQDVYGNEFMHGYIECRLKTKSPLYIRGMLTLEEFNDLDLDEKKTFCKKIKNKPDFFHVSKKEEPIIPGSSLRGMIRAVFEIFSHSSVSWVQKSKVKYTDNKKEKEYKHSPLDFVPECIKDEKIIDFTRAVFGRAGEGDEDSIAGRVNFTDGRLEPGQSDILDKEILIPKILASPNPANYKNYLHQYGITDKKLYKTYDSEKGETEIRGTKRYWFQKCPDPFTTERIKADDTQHTRCRPVNPGKIFKFRIYFENLSKEELGILLWSVRPNGKQNYYHQLGMGKPLGMGRVSLEPTLYLVNKKTRYEKLFQENNGRLEWNKAEEEVKDHLQDYYDKANINTRNPRIKELDVMMTLLIEDQLMKKKKTCAAITRYYSRM